MPKYHDPDTYLDEKGVQLEIGQQVRCTGYEPGEATITAIDPVEGDVDDEGRPYGIPPCVTVQWHDSTEKESFNGHLVSSGYWTDQVFEFEMEVMHGG